MNDLLDMPAVDVVDWMYRTGHVVAAVHAFVAHGITDTVVIDCCIGYHEVLAALPDGVPVEPSDLYLLGLIGADAWHDDPENRGDWAAVAAALEELAASLMTRDTRWHLHEISTPQEVIAALLAAGRGPTYAQQMIKIADRRAAQVDLFGFELSPADFDDLLGAGVYWPEDLAAYKSVGLTLSEAVEFASDGICPAAIMQAIREDVHKSAWRETLVGLPRSWFRQAGGGWRSDGRFAEWEYFILANSGMKYGGIFTLADLRYLADRGWDDSCPLSMYGIGSSQLKLDPETSKFAADLGLNWRLVEEWGKALSQGKHPQHSSDTTAAPIIGYGGGKAWGLAIDHLTGIAAMIEAGVKPSQVRVYRSAGCRTIDDIVSAARRGISAKVARDLTRKYGRKPSTHREVYVIDSFRQLVVAADKDLETTT